MKTIKKEHVIEDEAVKYALQKRKEFYDWYVLLYNKKTTEYINEIEFETYNEAKDRFDNTEPTEDYVIVELVYSPQDKTYIKKYGEDNIVVERKFISCVE